MQHKRSQRRQRRLPTDALTEHQKHLFDEAKAREVSDTLRGHIVRAVLDQTEKDEIGDKQDRALKMRWLLTWKAEEVARPPNLKSKEPKVHTDNGRWKATSRAVIIGYQHPDLVKATRKTRKPELET